jgi:hypothetical protein
MKKAVVFFIFLLLLLIVVLYFIRTDERVNNNESTVFVKKTEGKYELYRNGKPFYIQGASGNSYLEELKKSGANTFRVYDTVNIKAVLDEALKLDLAVIVDLMLPKFKGNEEYYKEDEVRNELKTNILIAVENNKNHPALLMWNFNELEYPHKLKHKYFRNFFGNLVDEMHKVDSNHPISTSITGSNKKQIASLQFWCPQLDLISINVFGGLGKLESDINKIKYLWNGAYYISEWGINGPWEESDLTIWRGPIEKTSSDKATNLVYRFQNDMPKNNRNLGHLAFFWGQKQERTHTWFSLFSENGDKTQMIQDLKYIWSGEKSKNKLPQFKKMHVNGKSSYNNIILNACDIIKSSIEFDNSENDSLTIKWELFPENWYYFFGSKENKPAKYSTSITKINDNSVEFQVPSEEGPYRLFSYIYDSKGNFATANVPFYVLDTVK